MRKMFLIAGGIVLAAVIAQASSSAPAAGHGTHLNCCPDGSCCIALPKARPDMVAKVKSGELKRARASWWGFNASDSTECLQAAISSGVPELIIDFTGRPWFVRPLVGVSDQTLIFEYGTELVAKKGGCSRASGVMLSYENAKNVKLIGPGVTMRMHLEDCAKSSRTKGEGRHFISICSCRNILVEGFRFADFGGDAIYVGMKGDGGISENITLRDIVCDRNAISVTSVDGMHIENCRISEQE